MRRDEIFYWHMRVCACVWVYICVYTYIWIKLKILRLSIFENKRGKISTLIRPLQSNGFQWTVHSPSRTQLRSVGPKPLEGEGVVWLTRPILVVWSVVWFVKGSRVSKWEEIRRPFLCCVGTKRLLPWVWISQLTRGQSSGLTSRPSQSSHRFRRVLLELHLTSASVLLVHLTVEPPSPSSSLHPSLHPSGTISTLKSGVPYTSPLQVY